MNFIRIGNTVINLDNVTTIEPYIRHDGTEVLSLSFNNAGGEEQQAFWVTDIEEQAALISWFDWRASDVMTEYKMREELAAND